MIAKKPFMLGNERFAKGADLSRLSEKDLERVRALGLVVVAASLKSMGKAKVTGKTGTAPLAAASKGERIPAENSGFELPTAKAPQEMTVPELKAELDSLKELGVLEAGYSPRANKAELLQRYIEAMQRLEEGEGGE